MVMFSLDFILFLPHTPLLLLLLLRLLRLLHLLHLLLLLLFRLPALLSARASHYPTFLLLFLDCQK